VNYKVRHLTTYHYSQTVGFARCALRLSPQQSQDQDVLTYAVEISPTPSRLETRVGQFGERIATAIIETPHQELRIDVAFDVAVNRPALLSGLGDGPWEAVREAASASLSLETLSPANFIYPTALTRPHAAITAYVAETFWPGRSIFEAARDLTFRIKAEFAYEPGATHVSTPAIDAFNARRGVCQDFAHVMISGLRGLGLPAAYVSGYLRTVPKPGKPRLQGADATHAWVALWCGQALGWVGFDPTNALIVANDHIVLAVGRDYADVAPISGVVLGPGEQTIDVAVDVTPMDPAFAFERHAAGSSAW